MQEVPEVPAWSGDDWVFRAEGAAHMVFAYRGKSAELQGHVLRLRKNHRKGKAPVLSQRMSASLYGWCKPESVHSHHQDYEDGKTSRRSCLVLSIPSSSSSYRGAFVHSAPTPILGRKTPSDPSKAISLAETQAEVRFASSIVAPLVNSYKSSMSSLLEEQSDDDEKKKKKKKKRDSSMIISSVPTSSSSSSSGSSSSTTSRSSGSISSSSSSSSSSPSPSSIEILPIEYQPGTLVSLPSGWAQSAADAAAPSRTLSRTKAGYLDDSCQAAVLLRDVACPTDSQGCAAMEIKVKSVVASPGDRVCKQCKQAGILTAASRAGSKPSPHRDYCPMDLTKDVPSALAALTSLRGTPGSNLRVWVGGSPVAPSSNSVDDIFFPAAQAIVSSGVITSVLAAGQSIDAIGPHITCQAFRVLQEAQIHICPSDWPHPVNSDYGSDLVAVQRAIAAFRTAIASGKLSPTARRFGSSPSNLISPTDLCPRLQSELPHLTGAIRRFMIATAFKDVSVVIRLQHVPGSTPAWKPVAISLIDVDLKSVEKLPTYAATESFINNTYQASLPANALQVVPWADASRGDCAGHTLFPILRARL